MAKVGLVAWQELKWGPDLEDLKELCQEDHRACREGLDLTQRWLCRICFVLATPVLGVSMYHLQGHPNRFRWVQVVLVSMEDPPLSMVLAWGWDQVVSQVWEV